MRHLMSFENMSKTDSTEAVRRGFHILDMMNERPLTSSQIREKLINNYVIKFNLFHDKSSLTCGGSSSLHIFFQPQGSPSRGRPNTRSCWRRWSGNPDRLRRESASRRS